METYMLGISLHEHIRSVVIQEQKRVKTVIEAYLSQSSVGPDTLLEFTDNK